MVKKHGLGKDLNSLLHEIQNPFLQLNAPFTKVQNEFQKLPIEYLGPSPFQPRKEMNPETLRELADSIQAQGIIQPIVVRMRGAQNYEIIAGERRWRAAQLAGLADVPVLVKDISDSAAFAIALIENIQREDLNPIEEAQALQHLMDEFEMTHVEIAQMVGRSRVSVTNTLRLLKLPQTVKEFLIHRQLDMGHARALLSLEEVAQLELAKKVVDKQLSVRATEALVQQWLAPYKEADTHPPVDPNIRSLENELSEKLGTRVTVYYDAKGKGKLVIHFNNLEVLEGILGHLNA